MAALQPLKIGDSLTRDEIHDRFGGSKQSYLPTLEGTVVCGCFDPELNNRAPREIDVGKGPVVEGTAEMLGAAKTGIPVFLKQGTNRWAYTGRFKAIEFSRKEEDLTAYPDRRPDAVGVLYLEEEEPATDVEANHRELDERYAIEGARYFQTHLSRERSSYLADIKRKECRSTEGYLACEACGLSSSNLPEGVADSAFEVHHRMPLAELETMSKTRVADLSILCACCHRMIHRTTPFMSVELFASIRKIGSDA
jgi:hypothetical protein